MRGTAPFPANYVPLPSCVRPSLRCFSLSALALAAVATVRAQQPAVPASAPAVPAASQPPLPAASQPLPAASQPLHLQPSTSLAPVPRGEQVRQRPVILMADELRARPDLDAVAEGHVEFRRAGTVIRADRLTYDSPEDLAVARGRVQVLREGSIFRGPELQLRVQRFEGFFLQPEFELPLLGAGGRADRVDFLDSSRSQLSNAVYSSCPRDGSGDPDWLLRASRVRLDLDTNEGRAEGAVLQFLGVPILGLPVLSFPLSDDRKSGWLPPNVGLDSRSGFELSMPYYWNIAPNRDATITPTLLTRRGPGVGAEFRYLEPRDSGKLNLDLLPNDRLTGGARWAWTFDHDGSLRNDWRYRANLFRVSDDAYWEDFPRGIHSITPRLLPLDLQAERTLQTSLGPARLYARALQWQVLTARDLTAAIIAPYQRSPQLGVRLQPVLGGGLNASAETEVNRFTRPEVGGVTDDALTGWRWHALTQLSRRWGDGNWWLTPKLAVNAASYATDQAMSDGRTRASRVIPTLSVDTGMVFERNSRWFGQAQRQTLEPRLLYVNTAYRDQSRLPNFDSGDRDFNLVSLYGENTFSGIDRVADAHQLTAGVVTRWLDANTGAETMRLGLAQRVRFRDQRVTLDAGSEPLTQRLSDVLFEGSTALVPHWHFDAAVQYNPDSKRTVRASGTVLYSPGPFRTLSASYSLARGLSEQLSLGWQWPVYRGTARPVGASSGCGGTLYAVGRMNYSMTDSRITGAIAGLEYDAGCWIGRIVAERTSTGSNNATTVLHWQLEFVGLSRLGTNTLQVLKDNIPGYRLLRDPRTAAPLTAEP
ncbi:LPS-assembly protein LptD [Aquabacterium sp.]|uniref:LPS-assembly protein LptD n=1 Tax=Aquabacterium sp. TaxID=1872578 RepID=UPI002D06A5E0|nr:LPS-assembly protein LptD [Aquabacterium sp.]HSW03139.1 LPS-assembly protein LptD [Aquabacterium sp.]